MVNSTRELNSLLEYSPVNSSLHNLPVNRIFLIGELIVMYNN